MPAVGIELSERGDGAKRHPLIHVGNTAIVQAEDADVVPLRSRGWKRSVGCTVFKEVVFLVRTPDNVDAPSFDSHQAVPVR